MLPSVSRKTNDPNPYTPLESQLAAAQREQRRDRADGVCVVGGITGSAVQGCSAGGGCSSSLTSRATLFGLPTA